jgi:hypothetical protein
MTTTKGCARLPVEMAYRIITAHARDPDVGAHIKRLHLSANVWQIGHYYLHKALGENVGVDGKASEWAGSATLRILTCPPLVDLAGWQHLTLIPVHQFALSALNSLSSFYIRPFVRSLLPIAKCMV